MEYVNNELFADEENNNYENTTFEENKADNVVPAVLQQPVVSSTQTEEASEEFDENYSTEDDEDLMALYLADMYTPPHRDEETSKEDKNSTSDLTEASTSQTVETNAGQSVENPPNETKDETEERMLEKITDYFTKQIHNDMVGLASIKSQMNWLSMPLALRKRNVRNMFKVLDIASKIPVPESDSNTDD